MDEEYHLKLIDKLLASRKAEALSWLRAGSSKSFRNIGELKTTEESIAFIERIYSLGAKAILAVEIIQYGQDENTGKLLIELPRDRFLRNKIFAFEKQHAETMGFDGSDDEGQLYMFIKLD